MIEAVMSGGANHARTPRPAAGLESGEQLLVDGHGGDGITRPFVRRVVRAPWRRAVARRTARRYAQEPLADDILATTVLRHRTATLGIAPPTNRSLYPSLSFARASVMFARNFTATDSRGSRTKSFTPLDGTHREAFDYCNPRSPSTK